MHDAFAQLAAIGAVEALVHLARIRLAVSDRPVASGAVTAGLCVLRLAFVWIGAGAVIAGADAMTAVIAYAGSAGAVTTAGQWAAISRQRRAGRGRTAHGGDR